MLVVLQLIASLSLTVVCAWPVSKPSHLQLSGVFGDILNYSEFEHDVEETHGSQLDRLYPIKKLNLSESINRVKGMFNDCVNNV